MFPRPFGKYLLERELSRGGMARVMLATLRGTDGFEKKLVVKQIRDELAGDAEFVERFVTEAKTAVLLNHPNIVPVFELGVEQGTYFITMEWVRGVSIAELLSASRRGTCKSFSPYEGAYVGAETCRALEYAHRTAKVVHRDITPRNVMIDVEGQVKLIDFGIAAKALALGAGVFGSPGHMPPEQMRGEPLTPKADLFALAVLLMEAWGGRPLFRRASKEECEAAMLTPPPRPSDFDESLGPLDYVIAKALSMNPAERPQDASEMGRALRKYLQDADTMDIARALGERVSGLLEERASMRPPANSDVPVDDADVDGQGSKPQTTSFTQTFASREFRPVPSTRRLPEEDAVPSGDVASTPNTQVSVPPTERSIASGERPSVSRRSAALGAGSSSSLDDIGYETLATRPIETEAKPARGSQRPKAPPRGLLAGGALAAAALAGLWLYVNRTPPSLPELGVPASTGTLAASTPPPTSAGAPDQPSASALSSTPSSAPAAVPASASSGSAAASGVPSTRVSPLASSLASSRASSYAPAPSASTPASSPVVGSATASGGTLARAKVSLLCGAQTQTFVDGVARGACPVRGLEVSRGVHEIRFIFEPTGESRGERVLLEAGESVTVRADFTGATPQVWVSRP